MGVSCKRPLATGLMRALGCGGGGVLFYEINGDGEKEYSTVVVEVRGWIREYEARNTERTN
jgi:hypothetical protein